MPAALPCNADAPKTKCACIVEAGESTRKHLEGTPHKDHEDHIAGKVINSLSEAMKIHDAKGAVDKEWEKLKKIPAWQLTKVRNRKEVVAEGRKGGKTVHFESLMDICHLKNSELEPKFQKIW